MRECLQHRILSISAQMNEIEATRAPLLSQLAELDVALKALQIEYNTVMNQASPIASLPNEVLADIFEILHASEEAPRMGRSEVCVSHVTSHWRQVALGTPKLWTRIFRAHMLLEQMEAYLERSKIVPIDLHVESGHMSVNADSYTELIRPHMARCRHLSIHAYYSDHLFAQLNLLAGQRAPFLRSLELVCTKFPDLEHSEFHVSPDVLSGGAPLLTALRVHAITVQRCLSLNTLQTVKMMSFSNLKDAYTMYHTPNLSHLRLESLLLDEELLSPMPPIVLPHLVMLSIYVEDIVGPGHLSKFLQALSAPSLETLFLRDVPDDAVSEPLSPAKFPALRYLVISSIHDDGSASAIRKFAVGCPYITHLTYSDDLAFLRTVLAARSVNSGVSTPKYWPNLHTLSLPKNVEGEEILRMVLSREDAGGRLQKLGVGRGDASDSVMDKSIWREIDKHAEVVRIRGDYSKEVLPKAWDCWGIEDE